MEQDHRKIEDLLAKLEKTTERGVKTRERLFRRIKDELTAHEDMEESVLSCPPRASQGQGEGDRPRGVRRARRRRHADG
jgi:hypothetical protein